jgi:magnesium transporter
MSHYEKEIERAVMLALFVPLIMSSGGNSGSQASTLIVRALAVGDVKIRDWFRVMRRELVTSFLLGCLLAAIGLARILVWSRVFHAYEGHGPILGVTVACSLVGVVMFGSLAGSMLPFLLRKLRLDPASASAPAVATLVDVTGLVIYFTVASIILRGVLL